MLVLMTSICCTVHSREPFPLVSWNTLPTVCVWSTPRDHSGLRPSASARDILRPHRQWRFFARFFSKCVVLGEMHKTFVCIGFLKMDIKCLIRMYWLSEQYDIMCIYIHRIYIYISYIYHIYSVYIYIYVWKSLKSRYCVFLSSSIFSKSQSLASTTGQGWRFKGFHWRWQQFFFPARSNSTTLSLGTQQTQQTPARFFSLHRAWPGDARKCFGGKKVWKHWKLQWLMRILSDPLFDGLVTLQTTNLYHHLASQKTREGTLGSFDDFSGQYII